MIKRYLLFQPNALRTRLYEKPDVMRKLLFILILLLSASSCSKVGSGTIVIDLEVVDEETGAPVVDRGVSMHYSRYDGGGHYTDKSVFIGTTDQEGRLNVKRSVARKDAGFKVGVYIPLPQIQSNYFKSVTVYRGKKNKIKLEI